MHWGSCSLTLRGFYHNLSRWYSALWAFRWNLFLITWWRLNMILSFLNLYKFIPLPLPQLLDVFHLFVIIWYILFDHMLFLLLLLIIPRLVYRPEALVLHLHVFISFLVNVIGGLIHSLLSLTLLAIKSVQPKILKHQVEVTNVLLFFQLNSSSIFHTVMFNIMIIAKCHKSGVWLLLKWT
jgi:hypothetical protein